MNNSTMSLAISGISIKQDSFGRFCLNDLHKAAGNENKHRPSLWVENQQTKSLISELDSEAGIPALVSLKGGKVSGTFAVKELVYAYAMWISAKFHIAVIRAYDAMVNQKPYGLKELPVEKISPAQRQSIRHAVAQIAGKDKVVYQTTFWRIHEHFNVNSYKEINACDFDKVMELLGKPQQKMMLVPVDEFEALRNQKPIIKHALLPLETGEVSLLESRYLELVKAEEKLKSVEGEKITSVVLKSGKSIPIEELAAICNELGNFDFLLMPKKPLLEIKKAMTYIF